MPQRCKCRCPLGADKKPLFARNFVDGSNNLFFPDLDCGSVTLIDRIENHIIGKGLRHTQPGGNRGSPFPKLRICFSLLECLYNGGASARLDRDHLRPLATDPAQLFHLIERLPHPNQPSPPSGGINHHIRQLVVVLFRKFIPHRLLPFEPVRFLQGRYVEPICVRGTELVHSFGRVANVPFDEFDAGSAHERFFDIDLRRILREKNIRLQPGPGSVRRRSAGGISGRRDANLLHPQLFCLGDSHRQSAGFEGTGR